MRPIDIVHPWATLWPTWLHVAAAALLLRAVLACVTPRRRPPALAWRVIATGLRIVAAVSTSVAMTSIMILTSRPGLSPNV